MQCSIVRTDYYAQHDLRQHPWAHCESDPLAEYVDFKEFPESVEDSLVSFRPWSSCLAVQEFYELIRWLNGPHSQLETNDCGFDGIVPNEDTALCPKNLVCRCTLMLFYRDLSRNLAPFNLLWLMQIQAGVRPRPWLSPGSEIYRLIQCCQDCISYVKPHFELGAVELSYFATYYRDLVIPSQRKFGHEVVLKLSAWGDDEAEVMASFDTLVIGLRHSLQAASNELRELPARGDD